MECGCNLNKFNKIGIVVLDTMPVPKLDFLLTKWSTDHKINLPEKYFYYYAHSREFLERYNCSFQLDDYLSKLGIESRNFFKIPDRNVVVDYDYDLNGYKQLIDYISARRGLIIFCVNNLKYDQFWYDELHSYAKSLDLATLVTIMPE